jgi:acyl-CoA thioesterase I
MSRVIGILLVLLTLLAAAGGAPGTVRAASDTTGAASAEHPVILVFGDSLSAGYGLRPGSGWVTLLAQKLAKQGYGFQVTNASVSGETTEGGVARLPRALELHHPRVVILELGANDGLRGLPVTSARDNLDRMIGLCRAQGARVLLLGMLMPPNYGERYTTEFRSMYLDLARDEHVPLVPFLLAGVALQPDLMQADALHPNERGQPLLLANIWPKLAPLLLSVAQHGAASAMAH